MQQEGTEPPGGEQERRATPTQGSHLTMKEILQEHTPVYLNVRGNTLYIESARESDGVHYICDVSTMVEIRKLLEATLSDPTSRERLHAASLLSYFYQYTEMGLDEPLREDLDERWSELWRGNE